MMGKGKEERKERKERRGKERREVRRRKGEGGRRDTLKEEEKQREHPPLPRHIHHQQLNLLQHCLICEQRP